MKKFDKDKTYSIAFKDADARRSAWIHLHCMVSPPSKYDMRKMTDEERVKYLMRRAGIAYQVMTLLMDTETIGQAFGTFLAYIQELDKESLKYLTITEKKES